MLGPLPRWLTGCAYPFLPLPHRPSPKSQRVGCSTSFRSTTSERGSISRLQSFVDLQASEFAATQVVPTAANEDAYVTVLDVGPTGRVTQLFPNPSQPDNHVLADSPVEIGGASGARVTVTGPVGAELIEV